MAKSKRRRRRRVTAAAPKRRRRYRRNPARRRSRASSVARRGITGLNIKGALKGVAALNVGMFAAKFAAKRFGNPATETDPTTWNYMSYIKAALGGVGAGMLTNMLKPGMGQKVLEGALAYTCFKVLQNEVIVKSEGAVKWFGADDPDVLDIGDDGAYLGEIPLDESHRMEGPMTIPSMDIQGWGEDDYEGWGEDDYEGWGEDLVPVDRLGDVMATPGPLGFGAGDARSALKLAYMRDYRDE
jgi:hypothetical protein